MRISFGRWLWSVKGQGKRVDRGVWRVCTHPGAWERVLKGEDFPTPSIFRITTGHPETASYIWNCCCKCSQVATVTMALMLHCVRVDEEICGISGMRLDLWRRLNLGFVRTGANHILVLGVEVRTVTLDSALQSQDSFLARLPGSSLDVDSIIVCPVSDIVEQGLSGLSTAHAKIVKCSKAHIPAGWANNSANTSGFHSDLCRWEDSRGSKARW